MAKLNAQAEDTDVSMNLFPTDMHVPIQIIKEKMAVSSQLKYGIYVDADMCIGSWLTPYRNSLLWHYQHNCKVEKTFLNYLLLNSTETKNKVDITADRIPVWERKYLTSSCEVTGNNRPRIHGPICKSLILIKGMPCNDCFTTKSVASIASFLGDNQLLFVSSKTIYIYVDLNFCLHEKCMRRINSDETKKANIGLPILIYRRESKVLYDVGSGNNFLNAVTDISYETSATVYFDIYHNTFAGSIDNDLRYITNSKRSPRDVLAARPVSLDPAGYKRLEHKTKRLSSFTAAPLHRTIIAQPSDDVDERRTLHHNSRSSGQDISMDQYSFYQPRLTSILQNQSVYQESRNIRTQQNVAYGNFSTKEERRSSFVGRWSNLSHVQKVEDMVLCGFFYTGNGDLIRCYCCGIGLKDWGEHDDPLTEHVRYSPDCQFLIDTIPPTNLARIKASFLSNNVVSTQESVPSATNEYNTSAENGVTTDDHILPVPPRSPQYRTKAVRISSFSKWPRDMTQTPVELAEAGFFYTGFTDVVRCYVCDGGLQKWSPEDNPWVEHARWFPHCAYLRLIKGEDFIELVRLSAEHEQLEAEGASSGMIDFTAEQTENIVSDMSGLHISAKTDTETYEELLEETEKLRSVVKCEDCKERDANCLFLPCAHHRFCMVCGKDVSLCPICKKVIKNKVKTFMS